MLLVMTELTSGTKASWVDLGRLVLSLSLVFYVLSKPFEIRMVFSTRDRFYSRQRMSCLVIA